MNSTWYMCKYCMCPFNLTELMAHNREFHPNLSRDRSPSGASPPSYIVKTEPLLPVTDKEDGLNNNTENENQKSYQELTPCPITLESDMETFREVSLADEDLCLKVEVLQKEDSPDPESESEDNASPEIYRPSKDLKKKNRKPEKKKNTSDSEKVDQLNCMKEDTKTEPLEEDFTNRSSTLRRRSIDQFTCSICGDKTHTTYHDFLDHETNCQAYLLEAESDARQKATGAGSSSRVSVGSFLRRRRGSLPSFEVSEEANFKCDECGKQFHKNSSLQTHKKRHTLEYKYQCRWCNKSFLEKYALNRHSIIHTKEKRFECSQCGEKFAHSQSLKNHLARQHSVVHEAKSWLRSYFKCEYCEFKHNTKRILDEHVLEKHKKRKASDPRIDQVISDKGKAIHHCGVCKRGFMNKSNCIVHLRTHTGEKPFKCDICGKAFPQKAHLQKHLRIHKR